MALSRKKIPIGNSTPPAASVIHSSLELGQLLRDQRKRMGLKQTELAGIGNTGNRFIVEMENGKPTVQLQKVLDLMDLLGLEAVVRPKAAGASR